VVLQFYLIVKLPGDFFSTPELVPKVFMIVAKIMELQ
jgi:hypothetical protein